MIRHDARRDAWRRWAAGGWRWLAALMVLGGPIFLLGLGTPGLYDPHESLYAEIAREMLRRGDWLTPTLNGTRYLDKPPLFYWLIALSYAVCGVSEYAARLPVALAALGGVLLTYGIGRRLFDARAAFLAGLALSASLGYFVFGRQILPDMVLGFFCVVSVYSFVRGLLDARRRPLWALLFCAGVAGGVLTKGLVGLFPLVVVGLYLLLTGRLALLRTLLPPWGLALIVLLTMPWHMLMAWRNDGYFWHYLVNEHILRFVGRRDPVDYITLPAPVFLLLAFLWLLPWSPYLALAIPAGGGHDAKRGDDLVSGRLLLLLWAGLPLLFFVVSRARLPQYSLPALPALALLIGKGLDDRCRERAAVAGLLTATAVALLLPLGALVFVPWYIERYHRVGLTADIVGPVRLVFALLAGGGAAALVSFWRRRWWLGWLGLTLGALTAFVPVHRVLVQLEPWRSSKPLAALIDVERTGGARVVLEIEKDDPFEYEKIAGLAFYTGQPVELLRRRNPPKPSIPLRPGERFLIGADDFRRWWTSEPRVFLVTDAFRDGDGVLDRHGGGVVLGHVGPMWVVVNVPP
jgi:4-amino-4-deoxy-L-arabinose transferase-like glycosyltransferase